MNWRSFIRRCSRRILPLSPMISPRSNWTISGSRSNGSRTSSRRRGRRMRRRHSLTWTSRCPISTPAKRRLSPRAQRWRQNSRTAIVGESSSIPLAIRFASPCSYLTDKTSLDSLGIRAFRTMSSCRQEKSRIPRTFSKFRESLYLCTDMRNSTTRGRHVGE